MDSMAAHDSAFCAVFYQLSKDEQAQCWAHTVLAQYGVRYYEAGWEEDASEHLDPGLGDETPASIMSSLLSSEGGSPREVALCTAHKIIMASIRKDSSPANVSTGQSSVQAPLVAPDQRVSSEDIPDTPAISEEANDGSLPGHKNVLEISLPSTAVDAKKEEDIMDYFVVPDEEGDRKSIQDQDAARVLIPAITAVWRYPPDSGGVARRCCAASAVPLHVLSIKFRVNSEACTEIVPPCLSIVDSATAPTISSSTLVAEVPVHYSFSDSWPASIPASLEVAVEDATAPCGSADDAAASHGVAALTQVLSEVVLHVAPQALGPSSAANLPKATSTSSNKIRSKKNTYKRKADAGSAVPAASDAVHSFPGRKRGRDSNENLSPSTPQPSSSAEPPVAATSTQASAAITVTCQWRGCQKVFTSRSRKDTFEHFRTHHLELKGPSRAITCAWAGCKNNQNEPATCADFANIKRHIHDLHVVGPQPCLACGKLISRPDAYTVNRHRETCGHEPRKRASAIRLLLFFKLVVCFRV
ncbi:hypothetical protein OE88DRAFT_1788881 [Heliocybe sulcata]|uniref:C2H2-type domain-containing protein n=1 Tax=Heliocybe sulcata TaxID=5364 RepID=A0A5C3MK24_9AGAM|nr:hypothetical protein OE88DRAFT_1788881 [Heliocybe sulcata]